MTEFSDREISILCAMVLYAFNAESLADSLIYDSYSPAWNRIDGVSASTVFSATDTLPYGKTVSVIKLETPTGIACHIKINGKPEEIEINSDSQDVKINSIAEWGHLYALIMRAAGQIPAPCQDFSDVSGSLLDFGLGTDNDLNGKPYFLPARYVAGSFTKDSSKPLAWVKATESVWYVVDDSGSQEFYSQEEAILSLSDYGGEIRFETNDDNVSSYNI